MIGILSTQGWRTGQSRLAYWQIKAGVLANQGWHTGQSRLAGVLANQGWLAYW
jgi:hypothetical protein